MKRMTGDVAPAATAAEETHRSELLLGVNAFVEQDGFATIPSILDEAECRSVGDELERSSVRRTRAGARHLIGHSVVSELANDDRLIRLASGMLSARAIPYRATLFEKSNAANWLVVWHQDTTLPLRVRFEEVGWGPWSAKAGVLYAHAPTWALEQVAALRVHLDDSLRENGPLRVIPGSHRRGVLSDDEVARIAASDAAAECLVERGGVLAMKPLLIHSSSKCRSEGRRRVLHIEYAKSMSLAPGKELAAA